MGADRGVQLEDHPPLAFIHSCLVGVRGAWSDRLMAKWLEHATRLTISAGIAALLAKGAR